MAACLPLPPFPPLPALPAGITVTPPPLPPLPNLGLCCKINLPLPPLPNLPTFAIVFPALTVINVLFGQVQAYIDALEAQVTCPLG